MNEEIHTEEKHLTTEQKLQRRMRALEKHVEQLPTKDDVAKIVEDTMKEVLFRTGKGTKAIILTTAVIVGALVVIGGGVKWLLGIIGFSYIK